MIYYTYLRYSCLLLVIYFLLTPSCFASENQIFWIQASNMDTLTLKVIIDKDASCYEEGVYLNDIKTTLSEKKCSEATFAKRKLCELSNIKRGDKLILNKKLLNTSKNHLKRIVIIGDTGCHASAFSQQKCHIESKWPLKMISKIAAQYNPDLIVHLGDYIYKYVQSPNNYYNHYGDTEENWEEEFFVPAKELLQQAPWVFIRGNHESCKYAGQGFFRFFTDKCASDCTVYQEHYLVEFDNLRLSVFDTSGIEKNSRDNIRYIINKLLGENNIKLIVQKLIPLLTQPKASIDKSEIDRFIIDLPVDNKPSWLLTHIPILDIDRHQPLLFNGNKILQKLGLQNIPATQIQAIFSGDNHVFKYIKTSQNNQSQFIIGNGGSKLHEHTSILNHHVIAIDKHTTILDSITKNNQFGFSVLDYVDNDGGYWKLEAMNLDNKPIVQCSLKNNNIDCTDIQ